MPRIAEFYGIVIAMFYMVMAWARAHQLELQHNWQRARDRQPLTRIDPLD